MKRIVCIGAAIAFSSLCAAYSASSSVPDARFLASDMNFIIAGHRITVPAVAIRQPDQVFNLFNRMEQKKGLQQTFLPGASDPEHPMTVDSIEISVRQYQYTGERSASMNICALLARKWSQTICRGEHRGVLRRLPERFDLIDHSRLEILKTHWTVGKERVYDQVKEAKNAGVVEIGCDRSSRFCTATVETLPGLLAVWTVWSDEKSGHAAQAMAGTQAAALVQFVGRALGPIEDVTLLEAD